MRISPVTSVSKGDTGEPRWLPVQLCENWTDSVATMERHGMDRICKRCGHVNGSSTGAPTEACPACSAIYAKVENPLTRQDLAAASRRADEARRANAERHRQVAAESWEREAEAIRQRAREELAAASQARPEPRVAAPEPARLLRPNVPVCATCGEVNKAKRSPRGSMALEAVLWLVGIVTLPIGIGVFVLVGALFYSLWRMFSRRKICRSCGSEVFVPAGSPKGQAILKGFQQV